MFSHAPHTSKKKRLSPIGIWTEIILRAFKYVNYKLYNLLEWRRKLGKVTKGAPVNSQGLQK